ncbi:uncharacterized protein J7T54_003793 [Emericellopsis cladophorae]|uniref:Uncharacterized protein n=1 Tax=Emericellopsis cladophorae TaxID=2686198 RepID=A0A9P9XUL4_9HYPO|nr:uncharacterized protein J7T54_003793 [Emericellopsis cladophorae]KAI6778081.1 hypothetical protein J7T54_003793 [Emericellopsis cladophorae]
MDPGGRGVSLVNAVAQHLWGVNMDHSQRPLLEAFLESPVIHGALGQFWKQCRDNKIELKATNFARFVAKLERPTTQIVLSTLNRTPVPLSHEFFGCEEYGSHRRWTLRQLVAQFVCTAEAWRRLQDQDSTSSSLAFGPSELALDSDDGGRTEEVFTGYGCNGTSDVTGGPFERFEDAELDAWTSFDDEDDEEANCV